MDQRRLRSAAVSAIPDSAHEHTRFVAQILIFSGSGSLLTLLKKRSRNGNAWDLTGGGVETGETFLQAADNELREELQLNPSGYYTPFSISHEITDDGKKDYALMTFLTTFRDEISPTVDNEEHVGFRWQQWGSVLAPRTKRFDRFLNTPEVHQMKIEHIAAFSNQHKKDALYVAPPDPTQLLQPRLPSLEG